VPYGKPSFAMLEAQRGVWYGTLLEPDSPRFNMSQTCEVLGPVDPAVLRATFHHVSLEVEAVRLRCVEEDGIPAQNVGSLPPPPMEFVDFSDAPDPRESADAWIEADRVKVFDLADGPMTRHCLLKLAHDSFIVYSCANHISLDSCGEILFNQRTTEAYQALLDGKAPEARPFGSMRKLMDEESTYRASGEYDEDRRYWTERMDGAATPPSLSLGPRQGEDHQVVCSGNRFPEHGEGVALNPMIYPGSPYTMVVRYQPRQLHEAEVREMCGQFTDVLSSVVEDPELPR